MVKYSDGFDAVASALAHPSRRQIVDRLRAGTASTSELADLVGVGLPAVTKQLGVLGDAALVRGQKRGRVVTYELDRQPLDEWSTWLVSRRSFWHGQLAALDAAVERR